MAGVIIVTRTDGYTATGAKVVLETAKAFWGIIVNLDFFPGVIGGTFFTSDLIDTFSRRISSFIQIRNSFFCHITASDIVAN
jgi:hypothetical protein